jgi:thiol-disulfide isomerase/thioredoxin
MKKVAVALVALSFILTSCSGNAGNNIWGNTSIVTKTNTNYVEYSPLSVSEAKGNKVLFFHAAWCGTCVKASESFSQNATTDNLTVYKVDFDNSTDLRAKYDVTDKHTFVQIDSEGNKIAMWRGSNDISDIQAKIKGETNEVISMVTGDNKNYMDYTQGVLNKTEGDKVLFFHASWCGTCIKASESFSENATTDNLMVYKVDFDSATELRKKYWVTDKHTFVQVDSDGNKVAMWRGSNDIADIQANLKWKESMMKDHMDNKTETMMDKDEMSDSKDEMMKKEGKFVAYSAEEVASTEGTKVLFFHAKWCPACTGAAKNLSASTAPEGLNVFKVDYDTSTDLKKKYGIVGQHTFVQIDDNGKMLKRWFGSRSYADILAQL